MKIKETDRERQRRRRSEAEADGRCIICYRGKASNGAKSCECCLEKNRQANRRRQHLEHKMGIRRPPTRKPKMPVDPDVAKSVDLTVIRWWHFVGGYR